RHHITKLPNLKYCNFSSLPPDFPLEFLVKEMSRPEEAIKSIRNNTRMARIINFSNLLEKLIVQPPKTPVTIQVKDELIPQNNGFFSVSPEGQVQHKTNTEDDFITIDIRDTAPLLCGMTSAEELYYSGRISISSSQNTTQSRHQLPDPIKTLATMLPKTVTYNPDEYLAP
ncbi:MAG: sterol carrier protein domain-containing protein, partial [Defluviitaleaceae bacterium]|nr:sterol carrier protein domain-containing protein [Defluviitaleaceae bacterium]